MDTPLLVTRIDEVTVFAAGALVTRSGDLAALSAPGHRPLRIRIGGLPVCLDDASLRVRISGGAATADDLGVALEPAPADPGLPPAEDAVLKDARRIDARMRLELQLLDARLGQLDRLAIPERPRPARGTAPALSPTEARLALLAFRRAEAERLLAERTALREAQRTAAERLADLEARAAEASSARQAREHQLLKSAVVSLRWTGPGAAGLLQLDYLVPGARWTPSYTIHCAKDLASARIAVRAAVAQRSGEDWLGVKLTLSTAAALAWHELPELASLRIGRQQPPPPRSGWRALPEGAEALFADFDAARERDRQRPPLGLPRDAAAAIAESTVVAAAVGGKSQDQGRRQETRVIELPRKSRHPAPRAASPQEVAKAPASPPGALDQPTEEDSFGGAAALHEYAKDSEQSQSMTRRRVRGGDAPRGEQMLGEWKEAASRFEPDGSREAGGLQPAPDRPEARLLAYQSLCLLSPEHLGRGRLAAMPAGAAYLVLASRQHLSVTIDLEQVVALAVGQARSTEQQALPPRCQLPATPQFAYSYPAGSPARVPSDGAWHVVPLMEGSAGSRLAHVVVPRESCSVFRVLHLANPFDVPLLAGPADVYSGEEYLMTADLAVTVPGGELELGLGVEQGIAVARNTSFSEESAGMLKGSLALQHRIRISITNKLRRLVAVEVRERLPVAKPGLEDCKLRLGEVVPPWEDFAQDQQPLEGGHRWRIELAAGASSELAASYTVTIPAKNEISGGNRREA